MLALSQTVVSTTAVTLGVLGPGCSLTVQPPASGGTTVAIGNGTGAVTLTSGYLLNAGGAPVFISLPPTSQSATIQAIAAATNQAIGLAWVSAY